MKKLLGIVVLGFLLSGNAYAAKIKIIEKGSNYIILKEKRKFNRNQRDPILFPKVIEIVNNYCSTKDLIGFYILAVVMEPGVSTTNGTRVRQDAKGIASLKHRYFCAMSSKKAFSLFQSDKNMKSRIKIYPGGLNNYNGFLTKRSQIIGDYYIKTTNKEFEKKIVEARKIVESQIDRKPWQRNSNIEIITYTKASLTKDLYNKRENQENHIKEDKPEDFWSLFRK